MPKDTTQDMLKLGEIAKLPEIQPSTPNYVSSSFQGGQYQVGNTAQVVGPSGDAAMFGALAEIAGGVQKSVDIFRDIRGNIEKEEIAKAKARFKSIYTREYTTTVADDGTYISKVMTPEEKMAEWNAFSRDIWTPLLGDTWREEMNADAYTAFGSKDAQNKFESDRYEREFLLYAAENPKRNPSDAYFKKDFNTQYAYKHQAASANQWFQTQVVANQGELADSVTTKATQIIDLSISKIIDTPSDQEMVAIRAGTSEGLKLRESFKPFLTLAEKGDRTQKEIETEIAGILINGLITENSEGHPEFVLEHLARLIPEKATALARTVRKEASMDRQIRADITARENISQATTALALDQIKIKNVENYLKTFSSNFGDILENPQDKQRATDMIFVDVWNAYHQAQNTETDSNLLKRFPGWGDMHPRQQVAIIQNDLELIFDLDPALKTQFAKAIGISEDKISAFIARGSSSVFVQESYGKAEAVYEQQRKEIVGQGIDTLSLHSNLEDIDKTINTVITHTASEWNLSLESLQSLYKKKNADGSFDFIAVKNVEEWYQNLPKEEKDKLNRLQWRRDNFRSLLETAKDAEKMEKAGIQRVQQLLTMNTDSEKVNKERIAKLEASNKAASTFSSTPTINGQQINGSMALSVFSGNKGLSDGAVEWKESITTRALAQIALDKPNNESTLTNFILISPRTMLAYQSAAALDEQLGSVPDYLQQVQAVQRMWYSANSMASSSLDGMSTNKDKGSKEHKGKLERRSQEVANNIITGKAPSFSGKLSGDGYDDDGDISLEGAIFLTQSQLAGEMLTRSNSPIENHKLNTILVDMTHRIGGDLTDPQSIIGDKGKLMTAVGLLLLGKGFKDANRSEGSSNPGGNSFIHNRLLTLANVSNTFSLETMRQTFLDPEFQSFAQMASWFPIHMAKNTRRELDARSSVEIDGAIMPKILPDASSTLALSALSGQVVPEEDKTLGPLYGNEGTIPTNKAWEPNTFILAWEKAGFIDEGLDAARIADIMYNTLLVGNITPAEYERGIADPDYMIRLGASYLDQATASNRGSLTFAMEFFNSDIGIKHKYWKPQDGETKFDIFLGLVKISNSIDTAKYSQGATPSGFQRESLIRDNRVSNGNGGFERVRTVENPLSKKAWDGFDMSYVINVANYTPGINEYLNSEEIRLRYPADIVDGVEQNQGMHYKFNVALLESTPSREMIDALLVNWIDDHAQRQGFAYQAGMGMLPNQSPATNAIDEAMDPSNPGGTLLEILQRINQSYLSRKGAEPFIDPERMKDPRNIAKTIQKNGNFNPEEVLPYFAFSNVNMQNTPYLVLNREVIELFKKNNDPYRNALSVLKTKRNKKMADEISSIRGGGY